MFASIINGALGLTKMVEKAMQADNEYRSQMFGRDHADLFRVARFLDAAGLSGEDKLTQDNLDDLSALFSMRDQYAVRAVLNAARIEQAKDRVAKAQERLLELERAQHLQRSGM